MLRIDLLPRQIAIARTNKILVALIIVLLVAELAALGIMYMGIRGEQSRVAEELEKTTKVADEVRKLESEISSKEADLKPIQDKIDFIEDANKSGEQYWDRFHEINKYIYENARMTRFSLTGGNSVNFTVVVSDTTEAARFVLNLVHSPALANVSVSGLPAGVSIEGAGGAGGGGFQPMGGEMGMEPGMEPGMGEPGMEPGMGGPMGGGPAPQATAEGDITLNVTASLTEGVSEPAPSGGGGAGGAGGGIGGMPPGMDPGMMEPGMAEPGMEDPAMAEPPEDMPAE